MNRKIYWGLGVLILLFGGFMFYNNLNDAKFGDNYEEKRPKLDVVDSSPLTSKELDKLYKKLSKEISKMDLDEEPDRGLDFTKYTERELAHLYSVGIDLSLLPEKVADKIIAYQYRKKGLPPPTKGEITITNVKRTPTGGMTFGASGELLPGETAEEYTDRMIKAAEKILSEKEKNQIITE